MLTASILALAALAAADKPPALLQVFGSHEACMIEAERLNRTDADLRKTSARVAGLEYVCLQVKRVRT